MLYTYVASSDTGNHQRALVDLPEQCPVVHDIPNAIADLLQADILALEDLAQEWLSRAQAEGASGADASDLHVRRGVMRAG